jgi:integrase-like protein
VTPSPRALWPSNDTALALSALIPVASRFAGCLARSSPESRFLGHLSSDHDPLFRFHRWLANLRILEVEEIKSIPFVPVSHPFVERLIGTIRREFLDHVLIWNAVDLGQKLEEFRNYYNENRVSNGIRSGPRIGIQKGPHLPTF